MTIPRPGRVPWWPLLAAAAWLLATAWVRPLSLPDEGRYVGVAWDMLRSGDWLTPRLGGLPYFHKPPLFYWITAASLSVFGSHEWAARAAPWAGAVIGASALYLFARRWWSERVARWALLALVTQPFVFIGGQFANLDMLVAGCVAAAIFAFAHAALCLPQDESRRPALAAAWVFAALGVLAKGLIGAVLPALVIGAWLLLRRDWRAMGRLLWLPGMALFLLVASPWFVLMQQRFPDFGHYFFVVQHFARYAQGGFNNQQPFWFYAAVLALVALPWSAWLALAAIRRRPAADAERTAMRQLLWLWLLLVTGFFTLPQSKLVGYVLPVTCPLALLAADWFAGGPPASARVQQLWRASAVLAVVACLGVVIAGGVLPQKSLRELAHALRGQVAPGDRVVFLHQYPFDFPFYAGLARPAVVVEDWDAVDARRDNWRKELADAGHFDAAAAASLLLLPAAWQALLCEPGVTWVVAPRKVAARYPAMQQAVAVATQRDQVLWRIVGGTPPVLKAAGCGEKPTPSSGGT